jgi:pyruvate/2-oxoglutarate dehydrogenase complex dihydrolipoamide dehydrogenase (E3) component
MESVATSDASFDLTVIGSGPGGYVAAIRAAQLGEKRSRRDGSAPRHVPLGCIRQRCSRGRC